MSLNRFQIIGRLTKDPEIKQTPTGLTIANLSIAQNKIWKDSNGEKQEKSLFFNLTAFGKQAEILEQYTKKGSLLYIEANVENQSREDQEGVKKYKTIFNIDKFEFLSSSKNNEEQNQDQDDWYEQEKKKNTPKKSSSAKEKDFISIEDIPF